MEAFPELSALSDPDLKALTERKMDEERVVSYRRRILHGQIDLLRAARAQRFKDRHGDTADGDQAVDAGDLSDAMTHGEPGPRELGVSRWWQEGEEIEALPDTTTLSDADLRQMIDERMSEELEVSFERRMLHGHIDLLRAEVEARLRKRQGEGSGHFTAGDVDKLKAVLAHRGPPLDLPDELAELG